MTLTRRDLGLGTGGLLLSGCSDRKPQRDLGISVSSSAIIVDEAPPGPPPTPDAWEELAFRRGEDEVQHATLLTAGDGPLVVALHGAGEAAKSMVKGAAGWRDDYALKTAVTRVAQPPLTRADFRQFVSDERLAALNRSLAAKPYRGLAVVCPYCPPPRDRSVQGAAAFGHFIVNDLVPRARRRLARLPDAGGPKKTGIDGVSMGGRYALQIGLSHPKSFASIGALQPAIRENEVPAWVTLVKRARFQAPFSLRLATSDKDPFRDAVRALSQALTQSGEEHALVETPGPHDYGWNRGPGSYELLLWHERVLRGLTPA